MKLITNEKKATIKTQNYKKTLLVLVFWSLSYYLVNVFANIASYNSEDNKKNKILSDLGFKLVPKINALWLTDLFDALVFFPTLLFFFGLKKEKLFTVVHRALLTSIVCNLMRITTISVTSCIDPRTTCETVKGDLFTKFLLHRCGDCMYSGHTSILVLCSLVWTSYNKNGKKAFTVIIWIICVLGSLNIISNRSHYTSDVVIAYYITAGAWFSLGHFVNFNDLTLINKKKKFYLPINIDEELALHF